MDRESSIGPNYRRRDPPAALRGLVTGLHGYDEAGKAMQGLTEPAGLDIVLIINFGACFEIGLGRLPQAADAIGSFAAGLFAGPVIMNSDGRTQCIQVNFTPVGGRLFFGFPLKELADRMVDLHDLGDPAVNGLAIRLAELNSWEARLDLTARFVTDRLAGAPDMDREVAWACRQIEARRGDVRIRQIQDELGWSRRRLSESFQREFGLGPKAVARIVRLEAAEALGLQSANPNWADIAASCGYADQAHLTRDFAQLAGQTPTAFRTAA